MGVKTEKGSGLPGEAVSPFWALLIVPREDSSNGSFTVVSFLSNAVGLEVGWPVQGPIVGSFQQPDGECSSRAALEHAEVLLFSGLELLSPSQVRQEQEELSPRAPEGEILPFSMDYKK